MAFRYLRPLQNSCWLSGSLFKAFQTNTGSWLLMGLLSLPDFLVVKYCLPFLSHLVRLLMEVIIWVFRLQCASAVWECCLGFTSKYEFTGWWDLVTKPELFGIFIKKRKVIHFLLLPSSRMICRFRLLFLLGCSLDGAMDSYIAVWCRFAQILFWTYRWCTEIQVSDDSGW